MYRRVFMLSAVASAWWSSGVVAASDEDGDENTIDQHLQGMKESKLTIESIIANADYITANAFKMTSNQRQEAYTYLLAAEVAVTIQSSKPGAGQALAAIRTARNALIEASRAAGGSEEELQDGARGLWDLYREYYSPFFPEMPKDVPIP